MNHLSKFKTFSVKLLKIKIMQPKSNVYIFAHSNEFSFATESCTDLLKKVN